MAQRQRHRGRCAARRLHKAQGRCRAARCCPGREHVRIVGGGLAGNRLGDERLARKRQGAEGAGQDAQLGQAGQGVSLRLFDGNAGPLDFLVHQQGIDLGQLARRHAPPDLLGQLFAMVEVARLFLLHGLRCGRIPQAGAHLAGNVEAGFGGVGLQLGRRQICQAAPCAALARGRERRRDAHFGFPHLALVDPAAATLGQAQHGLASHPGSGHGAGGIDFALACDHAAGRRRTLPGLFDQRRERGG